MMNPGEGFSNRCSGQKQQDLTLVEMPGLCPVT